MAFPPSGLVEINNVYTSHLKRRYNLTGDDYMKMVMAQNGRCILCQIHFSDHTRNLFVDHCHVTGKIRKILCTNCNAALGHLREDPDIIKRSINYLNYWHKENSKWEWLDQPKMRHKRTFWSEGDFKKCSSCREWKEVNTWFKKTIRSDRGYSQYRPYCVTCNSKEIKNRKRRIPSPKKVYTSFEINRCNQDNYYMMEYGLTLEDYNKMMIIQNNKCGICGREEEVLYIKTQKPKSLSVDHCHQSGKARGLLCSKCNTGIGMFKENVENMENAIKYLEDHS